MKRLVIPAVILISLTVFAQPTIQFENVTANAGITATHRAIWDPDKRQTGYLAAGQAWGDYNNDTWLDLYVTGNHDPNVLYTNLGDGTFAISPLSEQVRLSGSISGGAVWADYDNDGWRDLYVLNKGSNKLFKNIHGEAFVDVTDEAGVGDELAGTTATWGDYDGDGWLDLYVVNWSCFPECDPVDFTMQQDRLYHNNGNGTFTDRSDSLVYEKLLGAGFSASFVDYDLDGDVDIYVVNDELQNKIGNVLWRNDGAGCGHWCWTDVSAESRTDYVLYGMGLAIGDYDNDSDPDFYFTEMTYAMHLLQNQGDGTFEFASDVAGVAVNERPNHAVGWGTSFFDFDNDGWLDLYVAATGYDQAFPSLEMTMMGPFANTLFRNNQDGTFEDVSTLVEEEDHPTLGMAYADYDRDGWLDYILTDWDVGFNLYRNIGGDNNWIAIKLEGTGMVNRDAVGTRVHVTRTDGLQLTQSVINGSGLGSGHDLTLHFGLDQHEIELIEIVWPDGLVETYTGIGANQHLTLIYGEAS